MSNQGRVGGKTIRISTTEFFCREFRGYIKSLEDFDDIVRKVRTALPFILKQGRYGHLRPDPAAGIADF